MPRYRFGYLPSPPEEVGLGHPTELLRMAAPLPSSASVALGPVVDQGQAGSCVGNSTAVAVQAAGGQPFGELPSRRYIYSMARMKAGQLPLSDEGTYIHSALEALGEVGYPPESAMPYSDSPSAINEQPSFESIREAIDQAPTMVTGAHRITSTGSQRVQDVKAAIASGYPVIWGTDLDAAFQNLGPTDVWPGVIGAIDGGHAMILHRYEPWQGKSKFATRSSWTANFADNGSAWISESAVSSSHASDFWIVTTARRLGGTSVAENAS